MLVIGYMSGIRPGKHQQIQQNTLKVALNFWSSVLTALAKRSGNLIIRSLFLLVDLVIQFLDVYILLSKSSVLNFNKDRHLWI
jgi:hypothetical protein